MAGPGQPGALQRWWAWWLSEPAPGTANALSARWAAIFRRVTRSRAMAIVAPVLPTLFVAAVAAAQLAQHNGSARAPLAAAIVFSVLLAVPLVWRRRYSAATFAFLAATALIQWVTGTRLLADVALLIALYAMFEHSPARINWLAALALELGAVLAVLRWERPGYRLQTLLLLTGTGAAALFAGIAVRNRRTALAAATERGERRERERHQQALLDLAAERARISREMHDIVAHSLSVMVRLSDAAAAKLPVDPGRSSSAMVQVSATGREALRDMRQLLGVLRTDSDGTALRPPPGLADLGTLFAQVRATGLEVEPEVTGVPSGLGPGVELVVYRTVQEALTNVLKHARHPTRVRVALMYGPGQTVVEVEDDGTGLPAEPDQHAGDRHGLTGIAERVAAYGGRLHARPIPGPGRGWWLRGRPNPEAPGPGRAAMTIRVAIVDDQDLVRTGFRMILEDLPDLQIVGEASTGAQAVRLAESYRPDVTLMDVRMPLMDGVEATRRIVSRDPSARVLILTTFDLDEYAFAGLRAGASGFLLKDVPVDELAHAIRVIAAGDAVVAPRVTRLLLDTYAHQFPTLRDSSSPATPPGLDRLTLREREVLLLVAGGLSNAEIASTLTVSETTAKSHVASILAKLNLPNRVHTVIYAYENGLVTNRKENAGPV